MLFKFCFYDHYLPLNNFKLNVYKARSRNSVRFVLQSWFCEFIHLLHGWAEKIRIFGQHREVSLKKINFSIMQLNKKKKDKKMLSL